MAMTLKHDGKVGIGMQGTNGGVGAKLHIHDGDGTVPKFRIDDIGNDPDSFHIRTQSNVGEANSFKFWTKANGDMFARGNVYVGMLPPTTSLRNSKPAPRSRGSTRKATSPNWPRPPDCFLWWYWLSARPRIVSR